LILKCAICRNGLGRFGELFDQEKLLSDLKAREASAESPPLALPALDLVCALVHPNVVSLKVNTTIETSIEELYQWATAFRARIAYEANLIFTPVAHVDHFRRAYFQPPVIRQILSDAPRQRVSASLLGRVTRYDDECALRYVRGISAQDSFASYMSYYQIFEYHMESCYREHLAARVKEAGGNLVIDPSREMTDVVRDASDLLGVPVKQLSFRELRALEAVIGRRVDPSVLAMDLTRHFEGDGLDYFFSSSPPFAEHKPVLLNRLAIEADTFRLQMPDGTVLEGSDADRAICNQIAARIYEIRCAITHAKTSKRRYSPYQDDEALAREIPLVRFGAEQLLFDFDDWL
jgi:hypothetical protein